MIAVAAALVALAVWLAVGRPPEPRLALLLAPPAGDRSTRPSKHRSTMIVAVVLAASAAWLLIGGVTGAGVAVACAFVVPRLTRRLESRSDRATRELLERQAPLAADLFAATVASGATMQAALAAVSAAVGEPMASALRPVLAATELGADAATAWRAVAAASALSPISDAVVRSAESGAPLAVVLTRIADDMRRDRRVLVEVAARSAGVRAVAPLAACFLPAFLLMGVVPVVASLAGDLFGG